MLNKQMVRGMIVAGLVCVFLAGIAIPVYAVKDTLVIGIQDEVASLDPAIAYEQLSYSIMKYLYAKLVTFRDGDFSQVVPELAESWEQQADGKTWIFHLRQGIKFSTGNPVNADAVVFSLQRPIKLKTLPSWVLTEIGMTENSIQKIDEYTVKIELNKQSAPSLVLSTLTSEVAGILDPSVVMKNEQDGDMGSSWLEKHSAGAGPFILGEQKRGEFYELVGNKHYWKGDIQLKKIIIKCLQEPVERMIALQQGEIDIAWQLQPDQISLLTADRDIQIFESSTMAIVSFYMNLNYPPLSKPEVRDAIRYAIDYDGIVNMILQGTGIKMQTFIQQGLLGHNPALPYSYNPEKARQFLLDGGYPDGFEVELKSLDFTPWFDIATKIQQDLANVGISVNINAMPADTLYPTVYSERDFQTHLWIWSPEFPDPDPMAKIFAYTTGLSDDASVQGTAWMCHYSNEEVSQLVEQAAQTLDDEKRAGLYTQITDIILDEGPYAILYTVTVQYAVQKEAIDFIAETPILFHNFPILQFR